MTPERFERINNAVDTFMSVLVPVAAIGSLVFYVWGFLTLLKGLGL
jgi:hypothetical protein